MPLSNLHFNTNELVAIDSSIVFTIPYTDIVFIRCAKPYLEIHLHDKQYLITQRLAVFVECLPHYFCMCNKSEIVNLMHIKEINKKRSTLNTAKSTHTISRARKDLIISGFLKLKECQKSNTPCSLCEWLKG